MSVNWFFYNFSSSSAGLHIPVIESVSPALDESVSLIKTIDKMTPKKLSQSQINSYQWLPMIGGTSYSGCYLFSECLVNGKWLKNENGVLKLDDIKNIKNTGITLSTLAEKVFLLKEWQNFGVFSYRVNLYIPSGKSVNNFFFGLVKSDE